MENSVYLQRTHTLHLMINHSKKSNHIRKIINHESSVDHRLHTNFAAKGSKRFTLKQRSQTKQTNKQKM